MNFDTVLTIIGVFQGICLSAVVGALIGERHGDRTGGAALGAILGPLGWLISLCGRDNRAQCPFCRARYLEPGASICAHCGRAPNPVVTRGANLQQAADAIALFRA